MTPAHAKDLVYVHSNLQLLSRHHKEYVNVATNMWDIARDSWNENASTSVTTSESEVQNETIDLENDNDICI